MCFFASFIPATIFVVIGYFVLFSSSGQCPMEEMMMM
jgi:hypothetical protein